MQPGRADSLASRYRIGRDLTRVLLLFVPFWLCIQVVKGWARELYKGPLRLKSGSKAP